MSKAENRDRIVDALLALAAEQPFEKVTLTAIAERAGVTLATLRESYDSRMAVLADYVRGIDERVLAGIDPELAGEALRERLFDVLVARFEAHAPHKPSIRSIVKAAGRDPVIALELNRIVANSMAWMLAAAGISSTGTRGLARAQGLAVVWARVMRVWLSDEGAGLDRTMAALDKRLREAERIVICVDRVENFLCRFRGPRKPKADAAMANEMPEGHPT